MKQYKKPEVIEEKIELEDIIASSTTIYGDVYDYEDNYSPLEKGSF